MATVYLTSDLHLGHKNISKFRGLSSEEENYEILKEKWHRVVTKRDTVILLGDVCFTEERLKDFSSWTAEQKILVAGNHDLDKLSMKTLVNYYDKVYSLLKYKGMWLSHAPIHPDELRGRVNVHGHCHYHEVDDQRYLNVCVEHTEMQPVNIELVRQVFLSRNIQIR
jgi:calcineurin-like phosphoesterase family protein